MNKILKISTLVVIMLSTISGFAQETITFGAYDEESDQRIRTLFHRDQRDGFYGALSTGYMPIDDMHGVTVSARGAWILDHYFAVGLGGSCFVTGIDNIDMMFDYDVDDNGEKLYGGGYGGLFLEPIVAPMSPVHLSFPILAGFGAVTDNQLYYSDLQTFVVFEPSVELEVNLTRFMRIAGYFSYRFTSKLNFADADEHLLNTYSTGITLKFGMF